MGGVFSLSSLACCFTSAACSAGCTLCSLCGLSNSSTLAKLMYALILLLTLVVSCLMLTPGVENWLTHVPFCEESRSENVLAQMADRLSQSVGVGHVGVAQIKCADAVGYLAVYRVCFVVTLFFLAMSLIMINVRSSRDGRAGLQNGFWGFKYLLLILGVVAAFFIPHGGFGHTWMYFGLAGGLAFIIVQLVLIVDFAHSWAEKWQSEYRESNNQNWFVALLASTAFFYALCIFVVVFCFAYYTGIKSGDCKLHEFFIIFNVLLSLGLTVTSVLPVVQEHQPNSGLLQASFVSLYILYLTWSAMTNQPDALCKPNLTNLLTKGNGTNVVDPDQIAAHPSMDTAGIFGLILWFCCVLYSSIRSSSSAQAARLTMTDHVTLTEANTEDVEVGGQANNDEAEAVTYNWSLLHLMFALATLYVMMTLTNWYSPGNQLESLNANMSAVWVKIISAWMCFAIYMWTLVAPVLLPDRDFSV